MEQRKARVSVSVLSTDFTELSRSLELIRLAGADSVHLDIMDGHFVPNISFGPSIASDIVRASSLPCCAHLMVRRPESLFASFVDAGVTELLFHVEATRYPFRALQLMGEKSIRRGVAVNPATPVETVFPFIELADTILLMSVEPGFGGQSFLTGTLSRVEQLRAAADQSGRNVRIAVDGGVDASNADALRAAGADELCVGTAFFRSTDQAEFVRLLRGA
ncbi:MAG: ribulose-phosphate 3-epimerase [Candidatus Cryosericum sp.]